MTTKLSPVELEIELFCRGMRIDESCLLAEEGRRISRTRAGLGSGLELLLCGRSRPIWVNVPVSERFATASPLRLMRGDGDQGYFIHDTRTANCRLSSRLNVTERHCAAGRPSNACCTSAGQAAFA